MQGKEPEYYPATKPWVEGADGVRLKCARCENCQAICFPKAEICPSCGEDSMSESLTSTTGRLYSYTEVHAGPRQFKTPYVLGYVDMGDGLRLFGQIEISVVELSMDLPLELTLGTVRINQDLLPVISYKFKKARSH